MCLYTGSLRKCKKRLLRRLKHAGKFQVATNGAVTRRYLGDSVPAAVMYKITKLTFIDSQWTMVNLLISRTAPCSQLRQRKETAILKHDDPFQTLIGPHTQHNHFTVN